jgi:hypothetical protein
VKRLVALLLTLLTVVHAQTVPFDIPTAMNTAKPMIAAIQAATGLNFSVTYISGYGLSYVAQGCGSYSKDWPGQLAQIKFHCYSARQHRQRLALERLVQPRSDLPVLRNVGDVHHGSHFG